MKIGIIDYRMGNLRSLTNALDHIGAESYVGSDKQLLSGCSHLILPGVGAFPDAMRNIEDMGLREFIFNEAKCKPLLGICLGMQLLCDRSYEHGETAGLGLIPGEVVRLTAGYEDRRYKITHMGWNKLTIDRETPLTKGINEGDSVYFVHSYKAAVAPDNLAAHCEYGEQVAAIITDGNIFGCQFHPEKSQDTGLKILRNFVSM